MSADDRIRNLANCLFVMRADGDEGGQAEIAAIGTLAGHLGASPEELAAAEKLVASPGFSFHYPERLSARIANLEDILFAAYADGRFVSIEKDIVRLYGGKVGITQEQFDTVRVETKARWEAFREQVQGR